MEPLKGYEIYQKTIVLKSTILAIGNKYKIDYELKEIEKNNGGKSWSIDKTINGIIIDYEFVRKYKPKDLLITDKNNVWSTRQPAYNDRDKYDTTEIFCSRGSFEYDSQETYSHDFQNSNKFVPKGHISFLKNAMVFKEKEIMENHLKK